MSNMLGSSFISVSYKFNTWKLRAYTVIIFEDGSQSYLLDYDAYGSGDRWNEKVDEIVSLFMTQKMVCMVLRSLFKKIVSSLVLSENIFIPNISQVYYL